MPKHVNKKEVTIHLEPSVYEALRSYRSITGLGINDIISGALDTFFKKEVVRFKKIKEKEATRLSILQEETQKNSLSGD